LCKTFCRRWTGTAKPPLRGDADAKAFLGNLYRYGKRSKDGSSLFGQNYTEAVKWCREAAKTDHVGAELNLADMYHQGQGTPQDYEESVRWYRKAADKGDDEAQYRVAVAYSLGEGTTKD